MTTPQTSPPSAPGGGAAGSAGSGWGSPKHHSLFTTGENRLTGHPRNGGNNHEPEKPRAFVVARRALVRQPPIDPFSPCLHKRLVCQAERLALEEALVGGSGRR